MKKRIELQVAVAKTPLPGEGESKTVRIQLPRGYNEAIRLAPSPVWVNIAEIHEAPYNLNMMNYDDYEALRLDMEIHGPKSIEPIEVRRLDNGRYEAVDGNHRLRAAHELGWGEICAFILENLTDEVAMERNFRKAKERGNIEPFLEGKYYDQLLEKKIFKTMKELASYFGYSLSYLSRRIQLNKLPAEARELLQNGFSVSHLEAIADMGEGEKGKDLQGKWINFLKEIAIQAKGIIPTIRFLEELACRGGEPPTVEAFLNKLPKERRQSKKKKRRVDEKEWSRWECAKCGVPYLVYAKSPQPI